MAIFLGLSDELIILIASHLSKPSHMLQLALTNKRVNGIVIQHLYKNVTFDRDDYPPFSSLSRQWNTRNGPSVIRYDYTAPHSNVLRLSNMIRSNTLPTGQIVTRLTIIVNINNVCNKFQTSLSMLLPHLSSLTDLTLESVSDNRLAWQHEQFSLAPVGVALSHTSQTLQNLSMHFFLDPEYSDGWTIGSLRHFSKLKYLSVQGSVLLGEHGSSAVQMPSLDSVLPPGLKYLRLHWCTIGGLQNLRVVLANFVKDSLRVPRKTEKVVVQLNARAVNHIHQSNVEVFERGLEAMNEEARQGGLDLRMVLEWREPYHWVAHLGPARTFVEQFERFLQT